jgi:hypothetical protein
MKGNMKNNKGLETDRKKISMMIVGETPRRETLFH